MTVFQLSDFITVKWMQLHPIQTQPHQSLKMIARKKEISNSHYVALLSTCCLHWFIFNWQCRPHCPRIFWRIVGWRRSKIQTSGTQSSVLLAFWDPANSWIRLFLLFDSRTVKECSVLLMGMICMQAQSYLMWDHVRAVWECVNLCWTKQFLLASYLV